MIQRIAFLIFLFCVRPAAAFDNVLLISIDTLRADYLSCYGSKITKTPNIDQLAAQGIRFQNVLSPAPVTLPAHVSMFTGLIPPAHQVHDNSGFYLDPKQTTITELFQQQGLKTAAFVASFPLDSRFGLAQGFETYDDSYPALNRVASVLMPERKGEEVINAAMQWIEKQRNSRWFVFVHLYDPHYPYEPPEKYRKTYPKDLYAGEVAYADEQVGRLLGFLNQNQLRSKTLIALTADHGESLGAHEELTHSIFAYESTLRIPLILAPFPAKTIQNRVRLIDLAPTLLEIQQLRFPRPVQGVSLVPWIKGQTMPVNDSFFEALSNHLTLNWAPLRGFYSGEMKYIRLPVPELYDVSKDPQEKNNLCGDTRLCDQWEKRFAHFFQPYEKTRAPSPVDAETAEQLRALGYTSGSPGTTKKEYGVMDDPKNLIKYQNMIEHAMGFSVEGYELKALEILDQVIQERPDYSTAYLYEGHIWSNLGFPEKAADTMKRAIANGIKDPQTEGKLGFYLLESGKNDEATEVLKNALKLDPRNLENWNFLGKAYRAAKQNEQAEGAFKKALEIDRSDPATLMNLGMLYYSEQKLDPALQTFQQVVNLNPNHAAAYDALGALYAAKNQRQEAMKYWELALQKNPQLYDAMINLAFLYVQAGQKKKALPLLRSFDQQAPAGKYERLRARARSLIQEIEKSTGPAQP